MTLRLSSPKAFGILRNNLSLVLKMKFSEKNPCISSLKVEIEVVSVFTIESNQSFPYFSAAERIKNLSAPHVYTNPPFRISSPLSSKNFGTRK